MVCDIFRQLVVPTELGNSSKPFFDMRDGSRDIRPRRKPKKREKREKERRKKGSKSARLEFYQLWRAVTQAI